MFNILEVTCDSIPSEITNILGSVVTLIQIGIPIILVILGMMDLGKAVTSQKEDEIKKAQSLLIKRLIYGVAVFLVVAIVKFVFGILGNTPGASEAVTCLKQIFKSG